VPSSLSPAVIKLQDSFSFLSFCFDFHPKSTESLFLVIALTLVIWTRRSAPKDSVLYLESLASFLTQARSTLVKAPDLIIF